MFYAISARIFSNTNTNHNTKPKRPSQRLTLPKRPSQREFNSKIRS